MSGARLFVAPLLQWHRRDQSEFRPRVFISVDDAGRVISVEDDPPKAAIPTVNIDGLIIPGLVDAHTHWAQFDAIDAPADALLPWLQNSIFPAETRLADVRYATDLAGRFMTSVLAAGTTTAAMFGSIHARATDIAFETAHRLGLRAVIGKMMMDENCPPQLQESSDASVSESESLIRRWHNQDGRLFYAVSPRFALTCSEKLLRGAALLANKYGTYVQTHLAESLDECQQVLNRFPRAAHYTAVYQDCGLLGAKSLLGHAIHLTDTQRSALCRHHCAVVHCPSANFRLGSGLMDYQGLAQMEVTVALGSDVAAGNSLSLFSVARDAVEVSRRLGGVELSACLALRLATMGGAAALGMDGEIGSLEPGKWADFAVLDGVELCDDAPRLSSALLECEQPPTVKSVYIAGHCRYTRPA